ncbi:MAG TPA: hypothetical protein VM389_09930 [Phycisphaerae bacterium]|nr:hypothetical protein [Phycisphaerae bacterium]
MADNPYSTTGANPSEPAEDGGAQAAEAVLAPRPMTYKRQMNRANIIMAALFVGAGALVFLLTLRRGPAQASAEVRTLRSEVNDALKQFESSGRFTALASGARVDTDQLLDKFKDQVSQRQIPASALRKDPFVFVPPLRPQAGSAGAGQTADRTPPADPKAQSRREAQTRFEALCLQGIQRGQAGMVAIVSNNLVAPGQRIDCFTVKKIEEGSVTLVWEGEEFVLKMP